MNINRNTWAPNRKSTQKRNPFPPFWLAVLVLSLPFFPSLASAQSASQPTSLSGSESRILTRVSASAMDAIAQSDCGKLISYTNPGVIAVTLPAASSLSSGCWMDVQNSGAGILTLTPTGSAIDGASSLVLTADQGVRIVDGATQYLTERGQGQGSAGSGTYSADGTTLTQQGTTFAANTAILASRVTAAQALDTTCAINSGSSNTYAGAMRGNVLATYADGMRIAAEVDTTSNGAAITLDCGAGPKTVYQYDGVSNPLNSQWPAGGQVLLVYGGALNSGAGGWRILSGGGSGSSGGGSSGSASSAITTTMDLPIGGENNWASGCVPAWDVTNATYGYCSAYSTGRITGIVLGSSGTPYTSRSFIWPSNWDSTTQVSLLIAWTGSYSDSNGMKLTGSIACVTPSQSNLVDVSFNTAGSSPLLTNSDFYRSTAISAVNTTGCVAGQMGILKIARDNTVTPNSTDALALVGVALQWTSH